MRRTSSASPAIAILRDIAGDALVDRAPVLEYQRAALIRGMAVQPDRQQIGKHEARSTQILFEAFKIRLCEASFECDDPVSRLVLQSPSPCPQPGHQIVGHRPSPP